MLRKGYSGIQSKEIESGRVILKIKRASSVLICTALEGESFSVATPRQRDNEPRK